MQIVSTVYRLNSGKTIHFYANMFDETMWKNFYYSQKNTNKKISFPGN